MDVVVVVASLVAALAAAGAVVFAYLTVRDARAFHAEAERERHRERLRVVGRTVQELWHVATIIAEHESADFPTLLPRMESLQRRLAMELVGVAEPLPDSRELATKQVERFEGGWSRAKGLVALAPPASDEVEAAILAMVEPAPRPLFWRR